MSHGKQFTLYTHHTGPNGWKVAAVLEELGLTYESVYLDLTKGEHKMPDFTRYNPNGRIPAIIDHANDDFVLWESDAIILYLVDRYDKERKVSAGDEKGRAEMVQWLFFQASGQGPYFGQIYVFKLVPTLFPERVPAAVQRYQKEAQRVLGVLDGALAKCEWLVGDRCTVADISFVPWNQGALGVGLADVEGFDAEKQFPAFYKWHQKLLERESLKKVFAIKDGLQKK